MLASWPDRVGGGRRGEVRSIRWELWAARLPRDRGNPPDRAMSDVAGR
jgi:hypothetical protein